MYDPRVWLGLRRIINAAGTMTVLGSSAAVPEAIASASSILPWFVEIDDLQRQASRAIAAATGAEAGMVTACASAGVTLSIAGAMTGTDLGRIGRLPDTTGMKGRVVVQRGHLIDYGAPIEQAIRLAGAEVAPVGDQTSAALQELEAALDEESAAAFYVVSHHALPYRGIPLPDFTAACTRLGVPVIVDAASEYDLMGAVAAGADIVIYSAHKFLGGLTAGIVAGRKHLVRAAYLQNGGIGRGMKVGKEGILGAIAALEAWSGRDHAAHRRREATAVALWMERLCGEAGIRPELSLDPTGNPITRLRISLLPETGTTAWDLADALAAGPRPVLVREEGIEHGHFELDPCNLWNGEAEEVAERLIAELCRARAGNLTTTALTEWRAERAKSRLAWPD